MQGLSVETTFTALVNRLVFQQLVSHIFQYQQILMSRAFTPRQAQINEA